MSRIGKLPVNVPKNVNVELTGQEIKVKGPHGELLHTIPSEIEVSVNEDQIVVNKKIETRIARQKYGLTRALINNMVVGVSEGYVIEQELIGVGYRAKAQGQKLELALGFSHPIIFELPDQVKVTATTEKGKNPMIKLKSFDKQLISQVAAKIRSFRKPEPYKGKGILFKGEVIRRKAGKTAAK